MRTLKYASLLLLLVATVGCGRPFGKMRQVTADSVNLNVPPPTFIKELYKCTVDGKTPLGKSFHLSGILLMKNMPDSSTRVVFQNEMGYSFFDFEWDKSQAFRVVSIVDKMDKKPLIKTLQKDFELLLMYKLDEESRKFYKVEEVDEYVCPKPIYEVHSYKLTKGYADYYYRSWVMGHGSSPNSLANQSNSANTNTKLVRIENYGSKKVATFNLEEARVGQMPMKATIQHHRANFTIVLTQLANPESNEQAENPE